VDKTTKYSSNTSIKQHKPHAVLLTPAEQRPKTVVCRHYSAKRKYKKIKCQSLHENRTSLAAIQKQHIATFHIHKTACREIACEFGNSSRKRKYCSLPDKTFVSP